MELAQLAVFVRPPCKGMVKTRLAPVFGDEGAATLYQAFVADTLALCDRVREAGRVDVQLWSSDLDHSAVSDWGRRSGRAPRVQPEGDLGARLQAAFDEGLSTHERVVIIGSDAPTLPLSAIVAAFDALQERPVVLGPSNDGGYYAIGATHEVRPRFERVRWSTPSALADTVAANEELGVKLLAPWYDIDEPDDLQVLRAHLSVNPAAAPSTARSLATLDAAQR